MAVYLTGDTHGGFHMDSLRELDDFDPGTGAKPKRGDFLIIVGDFGYPWDFSEVECEDIAWLESRPYTVLFIDGNHERYDHWTHRPVEEWRGGRVQRISSHSPIRRLMRGEVFELDGQRIFTMGGAASPDKARRIPQVDWWPQEMPSDSEYERAEETLAAHAWQVDYVLTHTCASRMVPWALDPVHGNAVGDCDRLTDFLDTLENRLTYKHWYFGHFHIDRTLDAHHTVLFNEIVRLGDTVR